MKVSIPSAAAAVATVGLGASQALVPMQAGQVFGMGTITDGNTIWLARMLGVANMTIGSLALDGTLRRRIRMQQVALLAGNATVTGLATARGDINKQTGASVLGFIGLLAYAVATDS